MSAYMSTLATTTSVSTTPFFGISGPVTLATIARIVEVGMSGEAASSVAMRTQFARPTTAGTGTATAAGGITKFGGTNDPAALFVTASSFATVQWVLTTAGGSLLPFLSWNAYGGIVRWVPSLPDEEIIITGLATLTAASQVAFSCAAGAAASSFGIGWKET